jgi:hypothetical protein
LWRVPGMCLFRPETASTRPVRLTPLTSAPLRHPKRGLPVRPPYGADISNLLVSSSGDCVGNPRCSGTTQCDGIHVYQPRSQSQ